MDKTKNKLEQNKTPMVINEYGQLKSLLLYSFKAFLLMVIIYFIAGKFAVSRFWIVVLGVFIFSVPVCLCGIYTNTIKKISCLSHFSSEGLLFKVLSGRLLTIVFWIVWSLFTSFFILIQFHTYDSLQWKVFFLIIPVFWCVFSFCKWLIKKELKPYLVINAALKWSRILSPFIMLIIYIVINVYFVENHQYASVIDAIKDKKSAVADMTGSNLVFQFSQSLAFYDGIKAYALSRIGEYDTNWYLLVLSIGGLVVFYNVCAMLSCLLIPKEEYLRLFVPLTAIDKPEPIPLSRIAIISAVSTFLTFFIYLPIFSYIEAGIQSHEINKFRQATESYITLKVEKIGNDFYKVDAVEKINNAKINYLEDMREFDDSIPNLNVLIDTAFDSLEANVDNYLDWYYSLGGEYGRIGHMLFGEVDGYMTKKLEESLRQQDAFRDFQAEYTETIARYDEVQKEYQQTVNFIMTENQVKPEYYSVDVKRHMSLEDALKAPIHMDTIKLKKRMLLSANGGAVAGLITAVIGKKIIAKVAGKAVLKVASKALVKVASKSIGGSGGAAAGAAAGAAVGSIIPGVGTMLGGILGGIVGGVTAGLAADVAILKLEEEMHREELKVEILASINEARIETKVSFGLE